MFNVTDSKVSSILLDITDVLGELNCNFYESLEFLGMSSSDRSSIKASLSVAVPSTKRWTTLNSIAEKLGERTYSGTKRRYNITTEEQKKPYRIDVALDYKGDGVSKVVRLIIKSSTGGSGGGSGITDIAESAQCLYASLAFNVYGRQLKDYKVEQISAKDFVEAQKYIQVTSSLEDMTSLDPAWKSSSFNIANMLFSKFGRGMKGQYQFHRGIGVDAIVNEGYKIVKKDSTNNVSVPQDENKWNPADIWMVRNDFDYDTFRLSYAKGRVLNFNSELLKQYNEEKLIGVSLKKTISGGSLKPININAYAERGLECKYEGIVRFSKWSKDLYFGLGNGVQIQYRNFSGNSGSFQGQLVGVGAAGGKMGGKDSMNLVGIGEGFNNVQTWQDSGDNKKSSAISRALYASMKEFNLLKPDDEEAAIVGEIANGGESLNKEDTQSYRYAKSLAFNLARGFEQLKKIKVGRETAADEAARDIYLYASSQTPVSAVHVKASN